MKAFNKNHRNLIEMIKFYRQHNMKTPHEFSINDIIEANLLDSFNEHLSKENKLRYKYNSVLDHRIFLLNIRIPFYKIKKKIQYNKILHYNNQLFYSLRDQIDKADTLSNRLKKEYDKYVKGTNKKVK